MQIGEEKVKLSLFPNEMIIYMENARGSTKKTLELINVCIEIIGYKINAQNSSLFLYTCNKYMETKMKGTRLFTVTPPFKMNYYV